MAPPAISNDNHNTHDNLLDMARDYVHETVATDEQLQKEKPIDQKVKEAVPNSMDDAVNKASNVVNNVKEDFTQKFNERIDEGTDRVQQHKDNTNNNNNGPMSQLQDKIYEHTKSPSLKEREQFEQADLQGKLQMMHDMQDRKTKDSVAPATQL